MAPQKVAVAEASKDSKEDGDESYEQDEFFDGEEETSKEVKRSNFSIGSLTNGASSTPLQTNGNQPAQNGKDPPQLNFETKSKKGGPSSESSP